MVLTYTLGVKIFGAALCALSGLAALRFGLPIDGVTVLKGFLALAKKLLSLALRLWVWYGIVHKACFHYFQSNFRVVGIEVRKT